MALKATIYKAALAIADMDRHYYQDHTLTLARHPSETDERMMVRLLAYALHADDALTFTKGLSTGNEPDLWQKDLSGTIKTWIEIGQPDEKRIRKACGRAEQVVIYTYSGSSADIWWQQISTRLESMKNLTVKNLPLASSRELPILVRRTMQLQCSIQDGQVLLTDSENPVQMELTTLKQA